ncbi:MAG: transcriptional regulator [Maritimibacter sp.]|nr:transcriptional regulator [Maritimibacter sp.]|tara:strand:- start:1229 stop:1567 length:339 start_codon:yes stop_codon:yes gene_type:complete
MDSLFSALADQTRRDVVERLTRGEAPVKELAAPHDMALPSFMKHIDRLEEAGVVSTRKVGRQRIVALTPGAFGPAETWLDRQKQVWEGRLDRLEALARKIEAETNTFPGDDP